jgi:putative membrane protein
MSELNDPRVFFAAERTLLAWNRTALSLMAFGFVIERFGLFLNVLFHHHSASVQRSLSFWIGLAFITLGILTCASAIAQYRLVLRSLGSSEIPSGYRTATGVLLNLAVILLGAVLMLYLFHGAKA